MSQFSVVSGSADGRKIAECAIEDDATLVAKGAAMVTRKPHFVAKGKKLIWWYDRSGKRHACDDNQ